MHLGAQTLWGRRHRLGELHSMRGRRLLQHAWCVWCTVRTVGLHNAGAASGVLSTSLDIDY